jgi:hypothetical protein
VSFAIYIILLSTCISLILSRSSLTSKPVRALAVILLIHGYVTSWSTYKQVSGYPTADVLPKKFEIVWARVVEEQSGDFIELWIDYDTPILSKLVARFSLAHGWNDISRVYRIPYSDENHEMVLEIQRKIEGGEKAGIINEDNNSNSSLDLREASENYSIEFESRKITK